MPIRLSGIVSRSMYPYGIIVYRNSLVILVAMGKLRHRCALCKPDTTTCVCGLRTYAYRIQLVCTNNYDV